MKARIDPKRLGRTRIEAGLSMTELGKRAGVSKQHLSMVEAGTANFSPAKLAKVAAVLGCTIADLLLDDEMSNRPESAA